MYDKLRLFLGREYIGDVLPPFFQNLVNAKTSACHQTGRISIVGSLDNLRACISEKGVWIEGSLAKFFNGGSNIISLNQKTTSQAIEKLCDATSLDFSNAVVMSLEFGGNFLMQYNSSTYFSVLGELGRLKRILMANTTLSYIGRQKEFVFYDKIAEAKSKRIPYPEDLSNKNLLRVEMRLKKNLRKQLEEDVVLASTLSDPVFYRKMVSYYQKMYFQIDKIGSSRIGHDAEVKTVSEAIEMLMTLFLTQATHEYVEAFIDDLKCQPIGDDRKNIYRLRKRLKSLISKASNENIIQASALVKELDDCIRNCVAYW